MRHEIRLKITVVAIHQANYAHIESLRQTAMTLDLRLTATVTQLADLRRDLLAAPLTISPKNHRDVNYKELLDYAKRISKFTVPPTLRQPVLAAPSKEQTDSHMTGTAVAGDGTGPTTATALPPDQAEEKGFGIAALPQDAVQWLDHLKQIPFVPWPNEEVIKRGALAEIQAMSERGIDPSIVSEAEHGASEISQEVRNELSTDTRVDDLMQTEDNTTIIENGGQHFQKSEEKPTVFGGLDLYDPDEEP